LEVLGVTFDLARNTKEAEDYLKQTRYAVVISDFYRTDDPIGGYTLLEAVKRRPNAPPYIIYSESARPDLVGEAKAKGAFGETNNPQQLFDMVIDALKSRAAS
jgi:DNA-binding NtrC family response regulator